MATDRGTTKGRSQVATDLTQTGTIIQSWVLASLTERVKAQAEAERRSVSQVIRLAVEKELLRGRRP